MAKKIAGFYNNIIVFLFWMILSFLLYMSLKCTCLVDSYEHTFFLKDNPIKSGLIIAAMLFIIAVLRNIPAIKEIAKKTEDSEATFRLLKALGLLCILIMSLYFVLTLRLLPVSDQLFVQESALAIKSGDYSSLQKGGYLSVYPNQLGLVWLSYIFFNIFGAENYIAFQIINALLLTWFYKRLSDITEIIYPEKKSAQLLVLLAGIVFYPLQIYCTFVYGTIPGLALSVSSVYYALKTHDDFKKSHCFMSALTIMLAMLFKTNYLIVFIAVFLHSIAALFENSKKSSAKKELLILPVLLIIAFLIQAKLPAVVTKAVTGITPGNGASSLSWIAMGLQESGLAEGWYNGYNIDTINEYDFDSELQAKASKQAISERITYFAGNPHYALQFFTRKITSQWNDPTYESYWILRTLDNSSANIFSDSEEAGTDFLNLLQAIMLTGCLMFAVTTTFKRKKSGAHKEGSSLAPELLLEIILIGGFFFHIMWEAKSQYTLPYIGLIIPISVAGYYRFMHLISGASKKTLVPVLIKALIPIALLTIIYSGSIGRNLTSDNEAYKNTINAQNP